MKHREEKLNLRDIIRISLLRGENRVFTLKEIDSHDCIPYFIFLKFAQ